MLQLQRASAGSGKTYTLAKKFIEYYISDYDETGRRRLRPVRSLRESLQRILAITFTNKATNEMKLRIVEKLNALGCWTPAVSVSDVDYLKDLSLINIAEPPRPLYLE
ncbi:MAG: UvrD-helicase domain-containing protein [Muribaculaceae bacterium]|nr:UvrD-helicase domain-containing protein [Muribaculaceae bacterium]